MATSRATPHFRDITRLYIGWPTRGDTWRNGGEPARNAVLEYACLVLQHTQHAEVLLVAGTQDALVEAKVAVEGTGFCTRIRAMHVPFDDCWLQDIGPVFVRRKDGRLEGVSFAFNGWGGGVCYSEYFNDAKFGRSFCATIDGGGGSDGIECRSVDINLEGGAIITNGSGTAVLTRECVRHRGLDEKRVAEELKEALGIDEILWIPYGAPHDADTNGHADNAAVFVAENRVLLQWYPDGDEDGNMRCKAALNALKNAKPQLDVCFVQAPDEMTRMKEEADGIRTKEGSQKRPAGEPLCASYTNIVVVENKVFAPSFGVPQDAPARADIARAFEIPIESVVPVPAREFVLAGGGLHCMSLAMPCYKQ